MEQVSSDRVLHDPDCPMTNGDPESRTSCICNRSQWATEDGSHRTVPEGGTDKVQLTPEEQRAADAILEVMDAIRDLYGGRNPCNFVEEAIPAVHRLQQFVQQHYLHRIHPEYWSDWSAPLVLDSGFYAT